MTPLYAAHVTTADWAAMKADNARLRSDNAHLLEQITALRIPPQDQRITREGD